jgi:hypothetical protein
MNASVQHAGRSLRLSAEDLKTRMATGESVTILDARGEGDWASSPVKIRGAIRVHAARLEVDPSWPRDRLTVVY